MPGNRRQPEPRRLRVAARTSPRYGAAPNRPARRAGQPRADRRFRRWPYPGATPAGRAELLVMAHRGGSGSAGFRWPLPCWRRAGCAGSAAPHGARSAGNSGGVRNGGGTPRRSPGSPPCGSPDDDGQTWLRLGDPPSPVPAPFGTLLHQLAATRHDHVPANRDSGWLFPGRHAASPPPTIPHGRPAPRPRPAAAHRPDLALRQLVLAVPAPVIADALGFHHTTTTRQHLNAGGPWNQYAGGDHEP